MLPSPDCVCLKNPKEDEMSVIPLSQEIQQQIVDSLKVLQPYKIILFGSYAYGIPRTDSDIDLVFIANEEGYKSFSERIEIKMKIMRKLDQLEQAVDVLAYTKQEWEDLQLKNSSFIREINHKGVMLENVA
ncbi:MAG TPA: nucleotidyltransferase domain-containing protein [Sulfuricurvum sp.]|nr:nucleotidyltransferase domain-containing protein [Sulfuricurvum sp.]